MKIFDRKENMRERLWFVDYWANYVRTHPVKVWSAQQNTLINSALRSAKQCSRKEYLKMKGEKCSL